MDRRQALEFLGQAMALPNVNLSSIARDLGIDPSQVSRIAAGRFVKLEGHALRVCKYAQNLVQGSKAQSDEAVFSDMEQKLARLSAVNPWAARAVSDLINALAEG